MKTILVPTDFSEIAENAARYAIELAGFYKNTKVLLFNAYSVQIAVGDPPTIPVPFEEIEKERAKLLKEFDKKLKHIQGNIETELVVRPGFAVDEILSLSEDKRADLIIMGITGAGKSKRGSGSLTTSIMKASKRPVLIIPQDVKFKKPERIALAYDHSKILHDELVKEIKGYVKLFDAKILIFDVLKKTEQVSPEKMLVEANLENSFEDIDYSIHFPAGDNLLEEINSFIEKNEVDMLIMIPHHYAFFQGIFHNSKTKGMAFQTHVPLLSIHE
jgi:nucleotide-binding universal stress UspA family protein